MTTPIEQRLRAGTVLRIPQDVGCLRISLDPRSGWFICERCQDGEQWIERVFYAQWDELRDELGSLLVGAREEAKCSYDVV